MEQHRLAETMRWTTIVTTDSTSAQKACEATMVASIELLGGHDATVATMTRIGRDQQADQGRRDTKWTARCTMTVSASISPFSLSTDPACQPRAMAGNDDAGDQGATRADGQRQPEADLGFAPKIRRSECPDRQHDADGRRHENHDGKRPDAAGDDLFDDGACAPADRSTPGTRRWNDCRISLTAADEGHELDRCQSRIHNAPPACRSLFHANGITLIK